MSSYGGPGYSGTGRKRSKVGPIILVILAMLVLFTAGFGLSFILFRDSSSTDEATDASSGPSALPCTTVTVIPGTGLPKPGQVTTNVYNSTDISGLAGRTSEELKARGFVIGKVANDPLSKTITGTAEIRYGAKGQDGATLMRYYIPKAVLVQDDRTDATIDTVLGEAFQKVRTSEQVQKALTKPVPSPSGPGCPSPGGAPASTAPAASTGTTPAPSPSPSAS
ncbi:MAG: LytR C-terminal domain-containing protein [Candidatus Nanopelagicales bacterium]